jgi:hypothetical protein
MPPLVSGRAVAEFDVGDEWTFGGGRYFLAKVREGFACPMGDIARLVAGDGIMAERSRKKGLVVEGEGRWEERVYY